MKMTNWRNSVRIDVTTEKIETFIEVTKQDIL